MVRSSGKSIQDAHRAQTLVLLGGPEWEGLAQATHLGQAAAWPPVQGTPCLRTRCLSLRLCHYPAHAWSTSLTPSPAAPWKSSSEDH